MISDKDVIGYIEGVEEPDKYIIMGNHRDAWVFGAIDPSSGTCVLLEVIKAFGELMKQGWRPRRSILFASWGSEEYGLIGSQGTVCEHEHFPFKWGTVRQPLSRNGSRSIIISWLQIQLSI